MAGTLLHITLAQRALKLSTVPRTVKETLIQSVQDYRLGAVLVDLPFFENVLVNGMRLFLGREIRFSEWGQRLHSNSPTGLCRALIRLAGGSASGRAMALGALTHLAIDTVFHEDIERRVDHMARDSAGRNRMHKRVEDEMDLHVHHHLLGHSGMGTPYARRMLTIEPPAAWTQWFSEAIAEIHGEPPSDRRMRGWLAGLRRFGCLHGSSLYPWVTVRPAQDEDFREHSLRLAEQAIDRSKQYLEWGAAALEDPGGNDDPLASIPDRNLQDGGPALPVVSR